MGALASVLAELAVAPAQAPALTPRPTGDTLGVSASQPGELVGSAQVTFFFVFFEERDKNETCWHFASNFCLFFSTALVGLAIIEITTGE